MKSSRDKLRILFINAYDMRGVMDLYQKGLCPRHHLFGTIELRDNYNMEVIIPEHEKYRVLNVIGNWFGISLLDQQIRALFTLRKCDILYAPYATANTKLIILAKLLGIVRIPIVILAQDRLFGKPSKYKWKRQLIKKLILQYETIIFISQKMKADIVDVYEFDLVYSAEHFFVFSWGIDMGFFKKFSPKQNHNANKYIMSSGKTWRDYDQLISAARRLNIPMKIYCRQECYPTLPIPGHVQILSGFFPFEQICKDYADASIVLIPLASNPRGAFGFTSLLEAMAMGKPIIMSRNENVDIDIDNEKIGTSVEQEGWVTAISTMFYDESLLKEMGENSRKLGNEKFHIDLFAEKLAFVLKDTYRRHTEKV